MEMFNRVKEIFTPPDPGLKPDPFVPICPLCHVGNALGQAVGWAKKTFGRSSPMNTLKT
jgi:hypothetical protein